MLEWLLIGAFTEISDWVDHQARYYEEKDSLVIKRRQEFVTTAKQRQEVCDAAVKTKRERAPGCFLKGFIKLVFNLFVFLC